MKESIDGMWLHTIKDSKGYEWGCGEPTIPLKIKGKLIGIYCPKCRTIAIHNAVAVFDCDFEVVKFDGFKFVLKII